MRKIVFPALFCLGLLPLVAAQAYEVSPMRVMLDPAQGRNSATISVNNTRDESLPIEVQALSRRVDEDGAQHLEDADDLFVIFPPQALIPTGGSQAIRFQFIGDPAMAASEAFVIQVQEVPVRPEGFTGIQFAYNFGVAVYVSAPGARSRLAVIEHARNEDELKLTVENVGNDYAFTTHRSLALTIGGQRYNIDPQSLADRIENPILPPASTRTFRISIDDMPDGEIEDVALSRSR